MSIGKEFSMNSLEELTAQFKVQKDNGMTYDVFQDTEREIVKVKYSNDPAYIRRYDVRSMFRPFADKDKDQVNIILSDRTLSTQYDRVLWVNYDTIWDTLELNDPNVYQKPPKEIQKLIDKEVKKLIANIAGVNTETEAVDLTEPGVDGGQPTDIEAEAKAKLKGTVGGVEGVITINRAIFEGVMSVEAAKALLIEIYGFSDETASALVKLPDMSTVNKVADIKQDINDPDSNAMSNDKSNE